MPWFVRTGDHAGFCPAVAGAERRALEPDGVLELGLRAVIVDGAVDITAARHWAALAGHSSR
jgi:hypothetical protein